DAAVGAAEDAEKGHLAELLGQAQLATARLYTRKRCRKLAEAAISSAEAALGGEDARTCAERGHVLVAFDERGGAKKMYEHTVELGGDRGERFGRLGLAHVALLLGEFAEAHAQLDRLEPGPVGDLPTKRMRAQLLSAEHRWAEVAAAYAAI